MQRPYTASLSAHAEGLEKGTGARPPSLGRGEVWNDAPPVVPEITHLDPCHNRTMPSL